MSCTIYGNRTLNGINVDDIVDNKNVIYGIDDVFFARLTNARENIEDTPKPAIAAFNKIRPFHAVYAKVLPGTYELYRDGAGMTDAFETELKKFISEFSDVEINKRFAITKVRTVYFPKAYTGDDRVFEGEVLLDTGKTIYANVRCEDNAVEDTRFEDSGDLCDVAYAYTKDLKTLLGMANGNIEDVLTENTAQVDNFIDICNELYEIWRERPFMVEEWEAL